MSVIKYFFMFLFVSFTLSASNDGWVSVPRKENIVHQMETDDRSIWVVFAKTFGSERVLVRFPSDPIYRNVNGRFEAHSSHLGLGELSLIAQKRNFSEDEFSQNITYRDVETGRWIFEKHIDTNDYHYVLRASDPSQNGALFQAFSNSFEIEMNA